VHPGNPQLPCDFGRPFPVLLQSDHRLPVDPRFATLVHPIRFRFGDPLQLPFASQVGLELRKHRQHVQKGLACCGRGVDELVDGFEERALGL